MQRRSGFWSSVVFYLGYIIAGSLLFAVCAGLQGYVAPAILFAAICLGAASAYPFAKRQELGWVVDERGERQKVERVNRGQPLYSPTTHRQRIEEEAVANEERRKSLFKEFASGIVVLAIGAGLYLTNAFEHAWLALVAGMLIAFPPFARGIRLLGTELAYQSGFQDMQGAKVLDLAPVRPGPEQVATQKAHGDARVATEEEALDALKS